MQGMEGWPRTPRGAGAGRAITFSVKHERTSGINQRGQLFHAMMAPGLTTFLEDSKDGVHTQCTIQITVPR